MMASVNIALVALPRRSYPSRPSGRSFSEVLMTITTSLQASRVAIIGAGNVGSTLGQRILEKTSPMSSC